MPPTFLLIILAGALAVIAPLLLCTLVVGLFLPKRKDSCISLLISGGWGAMVGAGITLTLLFVSESALTLKPLFYGAGCVFSGVVLGKYLWARFFLRETAKVEI